MILKYFDKIIKIRFGNFKKKEMISQKNELRKQIMRHQYFRIINKKINKKIN
jgi:hypothetical protein